MNSISNFMKIIATILLVPIVLAVAAFLGFLGFGLDFNNAWDDKSSGGSGTMFMFMLPLGFITLVVWGLYTYSKRRATSETEGTETRIRQKVHEELGMGKSKPEIALNMILRFDGITLDELSSKLNTEKKETLEIVRELLVVGKIQQDIKQKPTRYYAVRN